MERSYGGIAPTAVAEKDPKFSQGKTKTTEKEKEKMLAYMFMDGAHGGFRPMMRDLDSDFTLGHSMYPGTVEESLQVMSMFTEQPAYRAIMKKKQKGRKSDDDPRGEKSFGQMSKNEMKRKGVCFKCKKKGHRAAECPGNDASSVSSDEVGSVAETNNFIGWNSGWSNVESSV